MTKMPKDSPTIELNQCRTVYANENLTSLLIGAITIKLKDNNSKNANQLNVNNPANIQNIRNIEIKPFDKNNSL